MEYDIETLDTVKRYTQQDVLRLITIKIGLYKYELVLTIHLRILIGLKWI